MTSSKKPIAPKMTSESRDTGKSGFTNTAYRDTVLGGIPEKRNKDQIEKANSPAAHLNPKAIR